MIWFGAATLSAIALVAEFVLAPGGPIKVIVMLGCAVVIGCALWRSFRRRRRHQRE
ncbi:MAG TPA: hypothetical protein VN685_05865 [Rhizomicrobium sp.]|nr:hypothetical protein [Rhizomicrobium sp.]